jgi:WD40 repeat protein
VAPAPAAADDRWRGRLRDARGARLGEHRGAATWIEDVAWSPSGGLCAIADGRRVTALDVRCVPVWHAGPHSNTISRLGWRPDGAQLAGATYGGLKLWRADGQDASLLDWRGSLLSVAWRPDGSVVAAGCQDSSVHFWRMATRKDSQMAGYPSKPDALSWSADGRWLATGGADAAVLWRFDRKGPEGTTPVELRGHEGRISCVAFGPSDMLVTGGVDGRVALWQARRGSTDAPLTSIPMEDEVTALSWTPRGLLAADAAGNIFTLQLD